MDIDRRTLLTTLSGTVLASAAGCSGNGEQTSDGSGQETESEPDEWTEMSLESSVQYDFPEGERINYESDQPAEINDLSAHIRGQVLEVRGTLTVNEPIPQLVEIQARFQQGSQTVGQPNTSVRQPSPGEEYPFTVTTRSSKADSVDNYTLTIEGPRPQ